MNNIQLLNTHLYRDDRNIHDKESFKLEKSVESGCSGTGIIMMPIKYHSVIINAARLTLQ